MPEHAVTTDLANWIAREHDQPSPRALRAARHAVLDWAGVALAGASDELVALLIEDAMDISARQTCPVIGTPVRLSAPAAARVNGAASHVLDFDDINKRMRGHPTVAILPALLSAAKDRCGADLLDALITGTEVACCLGETLGEAHYLKGFHTTATVGTVAAAAGVCRLLALDAATTRRALSLAATQAAGLRAMFGTMGKPLHAGLAAERGLMAARWAVRGITAPEDGIENPLGLGPVLSDRFAPRPMRPDTSAPFGIEDNVFKRHAACYYTHSAIEAADELVRTHEFSEEEVRHVDVGLQPALHTVCDIVTPKTGLEVKFSVRHLVAMRLAGRDTSDPACFTEATATDPALAALRQRVGVSGLDTGNRMLARVTITLADGQRLECTRDVSEPADDLARQEDELKAKFVSLARGALGSRAERMAGRILALDAIDPITALLVDLQQEA